jgi:hypothetical protein
LRLEGRELLLGAGLLLGSERAGEICDARRERRHGLKALRKH